MDWKNFLMGAAGVIGAPFTGGASLGLTGSALAAHGSKAAADQLQKAGQAGLDLQREQTDKALQRLDEAQAIQKQMYDQAQVNYAPYSNLGSWAAQTLGGMMGAPDASTRGAHIQGVPYGAMAQNAAPQAGMMPPQGASATGQASAPPPPAPEGPLPAPDGPMPDPQVSAAMTRGSSYSGGGGSVLMRAPDGSIRKVPSGMVDQARQQGGVPLG